MRLTRPLTVLALASLPLGCPDDPVPTETNGDESSSTGDDPSTTMTTNPSTSMTTTTEADSSSSDSTASTTMTTDATESSSTDADSSSSTDPTKGSSESSSTDATESSSGTDPSATESSSGTDPSATESSSGGETCPDQDIGNTVPTTVPFDTTDEADDFSPMCANPGGSDISYSWTAPVAGTYFITTSRDATMYDSTLLVLDGDCVGAVLGCNDDDGVGATSFLLLDLAADQTIVIVVDGFSGAAEGAGELYIDQIPAAGDGGSCCDAQAGGGCDVPAVEQCVCGFDEACCNTAWTDNCTTEAADICAAQCDVGPPSACIEPEAQCVAPGDDCSCVGCNDDGECNPADDDCTCDDCTADAFCGNAGNCVDDDSCDVYAEGCICADCADEDVCGGGGVPAEWTCPVGFYGVDDGCDCGCGAVNPDCLDATIGSCDFCDDPGSCSADACPGDIDAVDNSICTGGGVPAAWTCAPGFYGVDDGCDCGCGALDPDCVDATIASCDFCDDPGSCSADACPGDIDPVDNTACTGGGSESENLVAGPGLATNVTDNAYAGTLATMSCVTLPLAANGIDTVTDVQLQLSMSHTWVGDLTVKVVSPATTTVTVLSRPVFVEAADNGMGGAGDSSDLAFASPVTFVNGGATDAEQMGSTIGAAGVVCMADGFCSYDPNAGAAVPNNDFSLFAGESAVGNWQVCVGDAEVGDLGVINQVTLTIGQD